MFSSIGGMEILVILAVALMVLGPDHLPRVMRTVGKAMGELRKASTEFQRTLNVDLAEEEQKKTEKTASLPGQSATPKTEKPASSGEPSNPAVPHPYEKRNDDGTKKKKKRIAGVRKKKENAAASPSKDDSEAPPSADARLAAIRDSAEFVDMTAAPSENAAIQTPRAASRNAALGKARERAKPVRRRKSHTGPADPSSKNGAS